MTSTPPATGHAFGTHSLPDVCLRSPDSLVASLPYLLGFAPEESMIVLWLRQGRLVLTERLDLLPAAVDDSGGSHLGEWLTTLWAPHATTQADEVVIVAVSERTDLAGLVATTEELARHHGLEVRDALRVDGSRWWSFLCIPGTCCPADGRLVPVEVAGRVAAEFTVLGNAPLPQRASLDLELARDRALAAKVRAYAPTQDWLSAKSRRQDPWRDRAIGVILGRSRPRTSPTGIDRLAVTELGLTDVRVRDTVLWEMARMSPTAVRAFAEHLRCAVRGARPSRVAPVATCAAAGSWLMGDGARAATAVTVALGARPDYSLALLIDSALRSGVSPAVWRECMQTLTREEVRLPGR